MSKNRIITKNASTIRGQTLSFNFSKKIDQNVEIIIGINSVIGINELLLKDHPDYIFLICDTNVANLYLKRIHKILVKKFIVIPIILKSGEKHKSIQTIELIIDNFFKNNGTQKSIICALGGGVIGNISGFAASIIFRGIKLIHIPTTLLSQLDSAPDVKQSVNSNSVKNSIGSYLAPNLVIIDPQFLQSLSQREIRSGYGEAIKHAFAQDLEFLNFIIELFESNQYKSPRYLEEVISKTIALKIQHWKNTPTIWNDKIKTERLTHLGHTIGKVLEMIDLDYLTHGEAIAHGMLIEFSISNKLGYMSNSEVGLATTILDNIGLHRPLNSKYSVDKILQLLYPSDDEPIFALLQNLGNPNTISLALPKSITAHVLKKYISNNEKNK